EWLWSRNRRHRSERERQKHCCHRTSAWNYSKECTHSTSPRFGFFGPLLAVRRATNSFPLYDTPTIQFLRQPVATFGQLSLIDEIEPGRALLLDNPRNGVAHCGNVLCLKSRRTWKGFRYVSRGFESCFSLPA